MAKVGKPSLYDPQKHPEQLEYKLREGKLLKQISEEMGVTETTIHNWKNKYVEFFEAYKRGREGSKENIASEAENSFLKLIKGWSYDEEKTELMPNPDDPKKPMITKKTVTRKFVHPNVTAVIAALLNHLPNKYTNTEYNKNADRHNVVGFEHRIIDDE